mgnify:CR=1 FL=1
MGAVIEQCTQSGTGKIVPRTAKKQMSGSSESFPRCTGVRRPGMH